MENDGIIEDLTEVQATCGVLRERMDNDGINESSSDSGDEMNRQMKVEGSEFDGIIEDYQEIVEVIEFQKEGEEDGSIKLLLEEDISEEGNFSCEEEDELMEDNEGRKPFQISENDEDAKDNILSLIEDLTLNP